jgi:hypothetical protein
MWLGLFVDSRVRVNDKQAFDCLTVPGENLAKSLPVRAESGPLFGCPVNVRCGWNFYIKTRIDRLSIRAVCFRLHHFV